ncbi:MAG TPA: BrnT family toxin [Longimicrobiaceae bacterium]|nr:BrnT family toxin [Longimicrobiaceae bacterium]
MNPGLQEFSGSYEAFDWDEAKRLRTLEERGIDFADVARFFFGRVPFYRRRADRQGEERWQAFGPPWDKEAGIELLSVVYTERDDGSLCWIVSARAASAKERENYHAELQAR